MIGVSGSGKTTLARQIARTLALPHVELDALYWEANWQAASRPVFRGRVQEATAGDAWVVDGNYSQSRDIVWSRATHLAGWDYGLISVDGARPMAHGLPTLLAAGAVERKSVRGIFGRDSIIWYAFTSHRSQPREVFGASVERRVQSPDCVPVQEAAGSLGLAAVNKSS